MVVSHYLYGVCRQWHSFINFESMRNLDAPFLIVHRRRVKERHESVTKWVSEYCWFRNRVGRGLLARIIMGVVTIQQVGFGEG